jgi:CheY-like chemotaxis protein
MATVLIVDDEPDIREVIRFALEEAGFRVLEAGHAEEARKLLSEQPDLMLLDWMLPGRSGLELAEQLKQNPKTRAMPIIMISARGEEEDRVKGLDTGADDYITKPFSPREMVARVNAVLRRASRATSRTRSRSAGSSSTTSATGSAPTASPSTSRPPSIAAALLHDPRRSGLQPLAAARSGLGRPGLCRGAHRGRACASPAQGAGADRARESAADRARRRLSVLGQMMRANGSPGMHRRSAGRRN